jgi:carbamoyltransferase
MNILGISCFYHDAAAALLKDGMLVAASEEERFSRKKHDFEFPRLAVDFCLKKGGITAADLDYVVFYEKPFRKFERLMLSILAGYPLSGAVFRDSMMVWMGEKLWVRGLLEDELGVDPSKVLFMEHHLSHAASSFFCSPFDEAAILTVDGVGEWCTASLGRGKADWGTGSGNRVDLFSELKFPHSLGMLYSAFTAFLGFEVNEGEYKVMGMAPYGKPKYVDKVLKLMRLFDDGSFELDMSYFSYTYHREKTFKRKFCDLFGQPRDPKARFVTAQTSLFDDPNPATRAEMERNEYYADVAASIQKVTEDIVIKMANHLHKRTGLTKLCMAGGVALNSVANYRLLRETPFKEIYIQPAAGDAGGALGAALYAYHVALGKPRKFTLEHAYWGETYENGAVAGFLAGRNVPHETVENDEKLMDRVVDLLQQGKVIGWYQGAFEWGPRALGNRSILANPTRADMKDIVNIKIKFREPFRPFAPSILAERSAEYFDLPDPEKHYPPRFMLMVSPIKPDKQSKIPAVTHVDGTGRLQTVVEETNPRYHRLIQKFGEATGVPVVLNTSFNLKGEPIVTTPENAFNTFSKSGMDALVLGNRLVLKEKL